MMHQIQDAWHSIRSHRLRTGLTLLGIGVGVAALQTMLALGAGAQQRVSQQIGNLGANVLMIMPDGEERASMESGLRWRRAQLGRSDAQYIADSIPGVVAAAPSLKGRARIIDGAANWPTRLNATTNDYFQIRDWLLQSGRLFTAQEAEQGEHVVVLGQTVVEKVFGSSNPVGQMVRVLNTPMRVVGVLRSKGASASGRDQDDILFIPYRTALIRLPGVNRIFQPEPVSYILVQLVSNQWADTVQNRIDAALQLRHDVPDGVSSGFRIQNPQAVLETQRQTTQTITWLLASMALITLLMGGVSIMNVLLVSVTERRREIGLRRAVGARKKDIARLFLTESLLICVIASVMGVGFGSVVTLGLSHLFGWPAAWSLATLIVPVFIASMIGLCFGLIPAQRAANLAPDKALRQA